MPTGHPGAAPERTPRALVLCGDWGLDSCGVGSSEAAMVRGFVPEPEIVDPNGPRGESRRRIRQAARAGRPIVVVYPSESTVAHAGPMLVFMAAALARHSDLRVHLHEYRLYNELRRVLDLITTVGRARVVVSTQGEAAVLRASPGARLHRIAIDVIPPANAATPLETGPAAVSATATGVVGVFGFHRPDKGIQLTIDVLRELPPAFHQLHTLGLGWESAGWPADIRDRFTIVDKGPCATPDLPGPLSEWQLAVASFAIGATDGRNSLRSPLSHGIPTLTTVADPADLTLRPDHLVVVDDLASSVARAVEISGDEQERRDGAAYVHDFERRARAELCDALLGPPVRR